MAFHGGPAGTKQMDVMESFVVLGAVAFFVLHTHKRRWQTMLQLKICVFSVNS